MLLAAARQPALAEQSRIYELTPGARDNADACALAPL